MPRRRRHRKYRQASRRLSGGRSRDQARRPRPLQHAEQVARVVRIGEEVEVLVMGMLGQEVAHGAERGKVLDREADRVEHRDLARARPPGAAPASTRHSSVTGWSGASCWISPSMRVCGSYSTNRAARARSSGASSVLPGQSPPTALTCTPSPTPLPPRTTALRLSAVTVVTMSAPRNASSVLAQAVSSKPSRRGCAGTFAWPPGRCRAAQGADPEEGPEGQGLELGLGAVADQRHGARIRPRQGPRGQRRGGGGAQRRQQRHLGDQDGIAVADIGQHPEGGDGLAPAGGVLRVAVDVLEAVVWPSLVGISSMTPSGLWAAMRGVFWKASHREKSSAMARRPAAPASPRSRPRGRGASCCRR